VKSQVIPIPPPSMNMRCARAVATTTFSRRGRRAPAGPPCPYNTVLYTTPIRWQTRLCKIGLLKIDAFCRDLDPRVVQVSATLAASHQEVVILRRARWSRTPSDVALNIQCR
jgi:predicted Zn-dependent protease